MTRDAERIRAIQKWLTKNPSAYDETEAKELVNVAADLADEVDAVFAARFGWPTDDPASTHNVPDGTARGGAAFVDEVRWALDAVKRGDNKLAEDRLKRILGAVI